VIAQRKELETVLRDKNALTDDQKQAWFLIGGSVLFAGILLGILLPRLSVRRRGQWNSF
jgi:SH3 domain protein